MHVHVAYTSIQCCTGSGSAKEMECERKGRGIRGGEQRQEERREEDG